MKITLKKTKIVATLGPACKSRTAIHSLIKSGVNVFRINFSHAHNEEIISYLDIIRKLNSKYNYNVAILADLQGPKIRIGELEENINLNKGDEISVNSGKSFIGSKKGIHINYKQFPKDVKTGDQVLIDDGKYALEVIRTNNNDKTILKALNNVCLIFSYGSLKTVIFAINK